jgi:hypothetical protein
MVVTGFAVVPGVIEADEIGSIADRLDNLPLERSRAGARHLMKHDVVADVPRDPRILANARQFVGSTAVPYRATLFDKSCGQ